MNRHEATNLLFLYLFFEYYYYYTYFLGVDL